MKTFNKIAAQGDLMLIRVPDLDTSALALVEPHGDRQILAHSETGHHHTVPAAAVEIYADPADEFAGAMRVLTECSLTHERAFDTHEPLVLPTGSYKIRRQREYTPEGFRAAQD